MPYISISIRSVITKTQLKNVNVGYIITNNLKVIHVDAFHRAVFWLSSYEFLKIFIAEIGKPLNQSTENSWMSFML